MDLRGSLAPLFNGLKNEGSTAHLRELAALADERPNFTLTLHASETSGSTTADTLLEAAGLVGPGAKAGCPAFEPGNLGPRRRPGTLSPSPVTGPQTRTTVDGPGTSIVCRDRNPRRGPA